MGKYLGKEVRVNRKCNQNKKCSQYKIIIGIEEEEHRKCMLEVS